MDPPLPSSSFLQTWWHAFCQRVAPEELSQKAEMRRCLALFATTDGRAELWKQYPWFPLSDAHGQRAWTHFTLALQHAYADRATLPADMQEALTMGPMLLWIRYSAAAEDNQLPWQMTPRELQHSGKATAVSICARYAQWIR
jgi:hypothetical protein